MGYIGDKQQTRFNDDLFAQIYPHFKLLIGTGNYSCE